MVINLSLEEPSGNWKRLPFSLGAFSFGAYIVMVLTKSTERTKLKPNV